MTPESSVVEVTLESDLKNVEVAEEISRRVAGTAGFNEEEQHRIEMASGPELEKLIPIFEEGSKLPLARHVKNCAERLREFAIASGI